jgi:hypothetical protein
MIARDLFVDDKGRLRSGWRVAVFAVAFLICVNVLQAVAFVLINLVSGRSIAWQTRFDFVAGAVVLFVSAALVGWACGAFLEKLPLQSLGWSLHRGWLRNVLIGSLMGGLSLLLAAALATIFRGLSFSPDSVPAASIGKTLFGCGRKNKDDG